MQDKAIRVGFCTPTLTQPLAAYVEAMKTALPAVQAAGYDHRVYIEAGNPYISAARATMLRKAMDDGCDMVVFIDHDLSFAPEDLLKLIETPCDVVAGNYRFKKDGEEYMGELVRDRRGQVVGENSGEQETLVLRAERVPAGFLKVTRSAVERFMRAYPQLCYGSPINPSVDLFNHGAHEGVWWGEDYAFSRNWLACGGDLFVIPDLSLTHHGNDRAYPGNLHQFLLRQPGGSLDPAALAAA